jgi:hypothetical protein
MSTHLLIGETGSRHPLRSTHGQAQCDCETCSDLEDAGGSNPLSGRLNQQTAAPSSVTSRGPLFESYFGISITNFLPAQRRCRTFPQ